jgi:hypothetical protein
MRMVLLELHLRQLERHQQLNQLEQLPQAKLLVKLLTTKIKSLDLSLF